MILPRSSVRQAKRFSLQHAAPITPTKKDSAPPTSSSEEESGDETPVKATRKPQVKTNVPAKTKFTMIVKPDCMSQGKGIFLTRNFDEIPPQETFVVQEYMVDPYLIDNLKFDLRLYVLVLSCDPLKIFLYQEGLARFATR